MTAPALFLDQEHPLTFDKLAMPVALSDAPESWQREVASEIFKQVPYVGDYAVNVVIERVNPERGYGFGSAEISAKSDAPTQEQETLPKVKIPLIIRDRQLQPLDVFMDGKKVYPLSETRLHEHLFRTATFETSTRKPEDKGMSDQLMPPARSDYGGSGTQSSGEGVMGKFASEDSFRDMIMGQQRRLVDGIRDGKSFFEAKAGMKKQANQGAWADEMNDPRFTAVSQKHMPMAKMGGSLLDAISHTVPSEQVDAFLSCVNDPAIKVAALRNPAFEATLLKIAGFESMGTEKTAAALVQAIKPNVVQLMKLGSGDFKVKWANTGAFMPQETTMGPQEASEVSGSEKVQGIGPGGTVTLSTNTAQKSSLDSEKIEAVKDFGFWKVWDAATNQEMTGWVMQIIDLEMHPLDLFVFKSEEGGWSVQDEMAGVQMQREASSLAQMSQGAQPQGNGVFLGGGSHPMALGPFTIQNGAASPDGGQEYHAETVWGEQVVLSPTPGINAIQPIGEGHYAIPAEMTWLPLEGEPILLARSPLDVDNVHAGQAAQGAVDVGSTGQGEFNLEGAPVEKLAKADRQFIKSAEAEFLLVGMGLSPFEARDVMARAEKGEKVKVAGLHTITPLATVHREMTKKAGVLLQHFPYHLRRNLVKEAAALEDSETADKILSMNFINPENISTFASYLPDLEETSTKLAEMLVASRLGLNQIPEDAVMSSMRNLEEVIDGVKQLQQKQLV
jgi:hypothetical protein